MAVLTCADALVGRHSIQAHANVSVLNLYQNVRTIRTLMVLHASVSALTDHKDVPTVRFLTTIHASAVALRYTVALVDSGSIPIHVDVNVLNPDFHVPMLRNLTKLPASASAQIDQRAAPILRDLITIHVNVVALGYMDVPQDRCSTRLHASVSAPNRGQGVPQLRYSTKLHADVFVPINQGDVPTVNKFSTIIFVGVVVPG